LKKQWVKCDVNISATNTADSNSGADHPISVFDENVIEKDIDHKTTIPILSQAPAAEVNAPNNGLGLPIPVAYANGADHPITPDAIQAIKALYGLSNGQVCSSTLKFPLTTQASPDFDRDNMATLKANCSEMCNYRK